MKPKPGNRVAAGPNPAARLLAALGLLWAAAAGAVEAGATPDLVEQGRRIYEQGITISGAPLTAMRSNDVATAGAAAACVACHRRSGMGSVEGDIQMLPVTRPYLFPRAGDQPVAVMDLRAQHAMNVRHAPYTPETIARALREGVNSNGEAMSPLMPRYSLGDGDLAALTAYLAQLSSEASPGVTESRIYLATIITPGVDPERRQIFLDTLHAAVTSKNGSVMSGGRHMVSAAEMQLRTERHWDLEVWDLSGAPDTWQAQLEAHYRAKPVFAVLSGLGEGNWQPVQDFCNAQRLPCWFPAVDLPPAREEFYSLYLSRGVLLEADVLGSYLRAAGKDRPARLIQVFRDTEAGQAAAQQLNAGLAGSGIRVESRTLPTGGAADFAQALHGLGPHDAVMFWLRRADIAALGALALPRAAVYFSARMSGGEHAPFAPAWKTGAHLVYPYMLPENRELSLSAFQGWRQLHHLNLVDEPMQAEVFFATVSFTETQSEMLNNLYRDYLVERAEEEIGRREAGKAEQLSRDVASSRTEAGRRERERKARDDAAMKDHPDVIVRRESTTIYPRLSLAQTQRFASKGAYIVHFTGTGDDLAADSGWIRP